MLRAQQRHIVGKTIKALRDALDADSTISDKWILYTPRYNAFFPESGSPYGNSPLNTDGEGIDVLEGLDSVDDLDFVHFMMYDLDARSAFGSATESYFVQAHYDAVIQSSIAAGVPTEKLIMGFEPGVQAYTGVWAGMTNDENTIRYLRSCTGGTMYWAANDAKVLSGQSASVGDNCATLATFASGLSSSAIGNTCGQFSGRRRLRKQDLSCQDVA